MNRYGRVVLGGMLILLLATVSASKETGSNFVEVEVKGVKLDPYGQSPVVILVDREERKALPIWIGLLEASAIERELNQVTPPRPMTHDLFRSVLDKARLKVKEVKIVNLIDGTYHARLFLIGGKDLIDVDARPSDSIILALKSKAPIWVSTKIMDEQGISIGGRKNFGERLGIRVQELTPSLASQFNFRARKGVLVAEVLSGSAGEASGVKAGDIITKVNSQEVEDAQEFEKAIDAVGEDESIRIAIFRDDHFFEVALRTRL